MSFRTVLPAGLLAAGLALLAPSARGQDTPDAKAIEGVAEEFLTADGMLLRGRYHESRKGSPGDCPVVILLYAPGPDKDMTKNNWGELAADLTKLGLNVFRFDWRGHGQSKTIQDPNKFWNVPLVNSPYPNNITGPINQKYLNGFNKLKLKQELTVRDFRPGYLPVLVQDLAAARVHLDQKNDSGKANTTRIFMIGEGEAATIGMIWLASDYARHETNEYKPLGVKYDVVPPPQLALSVTPYGLRAGSNVRGAIWLSAKLATGVTQQQLKNLFDPKIQPKLRETPMLFMFASDDQPGATAADRFLKEVIVAQPKSGNLQPVKNTIIGTIKVNKKTTLSGAALLGNSQGQAEEGIKKYLTEILPTTAAESKKRNFDAPYYVDLTQFGFRF